MRAFVALIAIYVFGPTAFAASDRDTIVALEKRLTALEQRVSLNGAWKILFFRWHQMFLSPYDKGWVKENIDPGTGGGGALKADRESAPDFYPPYRADKTNRFDPPPPFKN